MHAYMIIAHQCFDQLEKLILSLDDARNDIFVHIDSKVQDFDFAYFSQLTKHARVFFTPCRINITWGDYSVVQCTMLLLKTAVEAENPAQPYDYYHLLSGADLPIKSNDAIYAFFTQHQGREFIHYSSNVVETSAVSRLRYYHFFRKKRTVFHKIIAQILLRGQKLLRINRLKKMSVNKGCNWFSITGEFARYIIAHMEEYIPVFRYSYCGDEMFIQTIAENSVFKERLYMPQCNNNHEACARLIDWERGNPYVFRKEDFEEIMASPCMFARKFDMRVDSEIIDLVLEAIK